MSDSNHHQAIEQARRTISELPSLRQLADEIYIYPLVLLQEICREHAKRGVPVPDHVLSLNPYLGETVIRALMEGGLVERVDDQRFAIHAYRPTPEGQAMSDEVEAAAKEGQPKRPRRRAGE